MGLSGFGYDPFGNDPYGLADFSDESLWGNMPETYKVEDAKQGDIFRKFINALIPIFDEISLGSDLFPQLRDPDNINFQFLQLLANDYGVVIDDNDLEYFKRSSIRNAFKWFGIKGTHNAYEVIGLIYGFDIDAREVYWTPAGFTYTPPPGGIETCSYCKSHTLDLWITPNAPVTMTPAELLVAFYGIFRKVQRVTPIYVTIWYPEYDYYSEALYIERYDSIPADLRVTDSDGGLATLTVAQF